MTDPIESPEVFWAHLCSHVTRYDAKHGLDFVLPLIRSRDAAVRAEALREAAGVADASAKCQEDNHWWSEDARRAAMDLLSEVAEDLRALASGDRPAPGAVWRVWRSMGQGSGEVMLKSEQVDETEARAEAKRYGLCGRKVTR